MTPTCAYVPEGQRSVCEIESEFGACGRRRLFWTDRFFRQTLLVGDPFQRVADRVLRVRGVAVQAPRDPRHGMAQLVAILDLSACGKDLL